MAPYLTDWLQNGCLLDMYARSDITALAKGNSYSRLQWEEVTVGQALALAQQPPQPSHASSSQVITCLACLVQSIFSILAHITETPFSALIEGRQTHRVTLSVPKTLDRAQQDRQDCLEASEVVQFCV